MTKWANVIQAQLAHHPRLVLAVSIVISLVLGAAAPFTRWDANPELITIEGSTELRDYRRHLQKFGSDELIVIAFSLPHLLEPAGLTTIRDLSNAFWDIEGVKSVSSLDSLYTVDVGPFGPFASPLIPDDITEAPNASVLHKKILSLPMARETLLDFSGNTTTIVVQPKGSDLGPETRILQQKVLDEVKAVLARPAYRNIEFHLAGSPVFNHELEALNTRDNQLFTPITVALIFVLLIVALRDLVSVTLAMLSVLATLGWVRGIMTFADIPFNTTTSLLAPLLMILTVSVSMHILSRYQNFCAQGMSVPDAVTATEKDVFLPAALTAITTAIGFISLLVSKIPSMRTFGMLAAMGVMISLALGAITIPAVLRLLQRRPRHSKINVHFDAVLLWINHVTTKNKKRIFVLALLCLGISALGIPKLRVATHDGEFFPKNHPLNVAYRFIEQRLCGVTPIEVLVESRQSAGIRTPEALVAISQIQDFLAANKETSRGVSILDWFTMAREATEPDSTQSVPLDSATIERLAFVLEAVSARDLPYWVQDNWSTARIASRSVALNSKQTTDLLHRLEKFARELQRKNPDLKITFTGLVPVFSRMEEYLLQSQISSFSSAFLMIGATFLFLFRSVPVSLGATFQMVFRSVPATLVALVPNIVPIILTLGFMGFADVPLDVVTIMVASITFGILVDDTIHLMHAMQLGLERGLSLDDAIFQAIFATGRAVVFTAVILAIGFSVLLFSNFKPTAHFGGLTALSMLLGLPAELFILPALIRTLGNSPKFRIFQVPDV